MEKLEVLRRLEECGVVAVVRGNSEEEVMKIIDACIAADQAAKLAKMNEE